MLKRVILATALLALLGAGATPAQARSPRVIDDNDTVTLKGNVHPHARPEFDRGPSDPALPMERMILHLKRTASQQADLEGLLSAQQDPASASYHRWLTPEAFGERFGPGQQDVAALTAWLTSHGFTVDEVTRGRSSVVFSGTAATVERAFHTTMRDYQVEGKLRHANAQDPAVPRGLSDLVGGVVSLHSFPRKPMHFRVTPQESGAQPQFNKFGAHFIAPADFATIYNLGPLYAAGIDGTGQTIAIVGRTHPAGSDTPVTGNWAVFRSSLGLPAKAPQVVLNGTDPGDVAADDGEADLDVEWSGAVAKNATILYVISKSTFTDGIDLSAQYIVNSNLAPIMSTSYGSCEAQMGTSENAFYNGLWQQAASQGITSFVSSGDSGVAGCSAADAASGTGGLGVNGLASTPYNVAVGGTGFNDAAGGYWASSNGATLGSALSYIPETAWNESGTVSGGSGLWSTGGGASIKYPKPSWQVAPGVPADGRRDVPDVSLAASGRNAYVVQTGGVQNYYGGTSAASPALAGLMALVVQKTGQRQGNANARFYQLGAAQYGSGGAAVFHDTTAGNSSVPGLTGFACTAGYDQATGLGSVDANALVGSWVPPPPPLAMASASLGNGTLGVPYSATLGASGGVPPYSWSVAGGSLGAGLSLSPALGVVSGTPSAAGVFSVTIQVADSAGNFQAGTFSQAISSSACSNGPVRLAGALPVIYPDVSSAYLQAAAGNAIQLQALDFSADLVLNQSLAVSLSGGYDCGFTGNGSTTGLLGTLRVSGGTVNLDKLRFR